MRVVGDMFVAAAVSQSCSLLFALRVIYLCTYLSGQHVDRAVGPSSSCQVLICVSTSARALVLPSKTLPARFVPPPSSICRIKICRRANEAQEQERRTEVTVAQWPNVWDRSAILAIASLTHSLTH